MTAHQTPKLYPAWREALSQLELAGIAPGQTIDREWVERAFGIEPAATVADYEKNRQLFRKFFWELRTELLKKHRLLLRAVNGVGYEVIHPRHQTARAMADRGEEVARALAQAILNAADIVDAFEAATAVSHHPINTAQRVVEVAKGYFAFEPATCNTVNEGGAA